MRLGLEPAIRQSMMAALLGGMLAAGLADPARSADPRSPPASQSPAAGPTTPGEADRQRRVALDRGFAALRAATSEEEATPIIAEIWSLWHTSGDPRVDDIMSKVLSLAIFGQGARTGSLIDEIIRLKPDFAEGWNQRATLRYIEGRFAESLADCVEVLKREPRHFGALVGVGLNALAQDDPRGALAAFRRAEKLNPYIAERHLIPALESKLEGQPL